MDPNNIPFNTLIVGTTNSGKTKYVVDELRRPFLGKFDYIVLICPIFVYNKTYDGFVTKILTFLWLIANRKRLKTGLNW